MTNFTSRPVLALAAVVTAMMLSVAPDVHAQGLTTPPDWRWRLDRPATLVTGQDVPDSAWRFVGMPPGWHITTGPGVVVFHSQARAEGRSFNDATPLRRYHSSRTDRSGIETPTAMSTVL